MVWFFFFQAEDGIRDAQESRGLGDVYKRQIIFSGFAQLPLGKFRELISGTNDVSGGGMKGGSGGAMDANDVMLGVIAPIVNTRCIVVWVIARNQVSNLSLIHI
eukprot:TRINITY_DN55231_c0_g1_i1.p2 TRINITY_DN55231_c0_g1~~TRINITY_DN55231_c0_g1_i1.p2  ORF type:complete len:104 (+),score=31.93 TRINITY_DN55231_c0_g1_i1:67-378(+)